MNTARILAGSTFATFACSLRIACSLFLFAAVRQLTAQPSVSLVATAPTGAVTTGQTVSMAVNSTTAGATYQWRINGVNIPGATMASYTLAAAGAMDPGSYDVIVSAANVSTTVAMGSLRVTPTDAKLINLSARGSVGASAGPMIMGFVSEGEAPGASQSVLLRGMGPSLGAIMGGGMMQGTAVLANPVLTVYDGTSHLMGTDRSWMTAPTTASGSGASSISAMMQAATSGMMASVGAFTPTTSSDSAMVMTAPAGMYTSVVSGDGGSSGIVLAECYDVGATTSDASHAHLVNMSARANVGAGNNVLIGGFVLSSGPSGASATLLLRAMGPSLSQLGVTGNLQAPTMTLFDGSSKQIATNAGWTTMPSVATGGTASPVYAGIEPATMAAMAKVGAFAPMGGGADSAMIATLPPGNYSVIVSGRPDGAGMPMSGVALLEIYLVR